MGRICAESDERSEDCCLIEKLRTDEIKKTDIGFNLNDETTFTEGQLKDCLKFPLPTISKFFVTYYSDWCLKDAYQTRGFWGGVYIDVKLDNQTEVIRCYIHDQKVGQDIWDDTI